MRHPRDMRTIQIDVTNACVHSCSNCTRFCGHHKKPFYMSLGTFKKAVDSLEGYEGIVGMMGGEPTLHPDFRQMAEYLGERFATAGALHTDRRVITDFLAYMANKSAACTAVNKAGGAGLWTSFTKQYYKHYEIIQEVFGFQSLNDHSKPSYHQPILITRKEYGIDDEEWEVLRDNCWIQNYWSASITPKGIFFCEIAASLDILFNGPGGFPIENGWWRRDISEFKSQLHWCEMCGIALKTFESFKRNANEETDDVSPVLYEKLKAVGSRKLEAGKVKLFTATKDSAAEDNNKYTVTRYLDDYKDRFGDSMSDIRPRRLITIDVSDVTGADGNFGQSVYNRIKMPEADDWVLLTNGKDTFISEDELKELYLNPGVCFVKDSQLLFSVNSSAFKRAGYDGFYGVTDLDGLQSLWGGENTVYLPEGFKNGCFGADIARWKILMEAEVLNDYDFRSLVYNEIGKNGINQGARIALVLPATFYFGRAVYLLLENMGYEPYVFIYEGNRRHYEDIVPDSALHTFNGSETYDFEALKGECDSFKERVKPDGTLMLVNLPYAVLSPEDGYGEAAKISRYISDKFIGCVNIRRKLSGFSAKTP